MKEYDLVRLLVDRPQYEKEGVKKGMFGAIMYNKKTENNEWYVIFSMWGTGEDIADICVREEDLEVWDHAPQKEDFIPEQLG